MRLLERCDAFRKPQRFADVLLACECEAQARGLSGPKVGECIHAARVQAVADAQLPPA